MQRENQRASTRAAAEDQPRLASLERPPPSSRKVRRGQPTIRDIHRHGLRPCRGPTRDLRFQGTEAPFDRSKRLLETHRMEYVLELLQGRTGLALAVVQLRDQRTLNLAGSQPTTTPGGLSQHGHGKGSALL